MKILAIRGQNLASLKGAFEIDLIAPPLGGHGLFAIAGPVGAGKSTVLDAMCIALFARTPRLSGRGGALVGDERDGLRTNDPRSLARRGCALAYAEVDFRGVDGRTWRARWQVRRARGQAFGRLLEDEQTLVDVESGQRVGSTSTEVRAAIEQKLGLSFDELTRSVVLSQGGFAAFLQARPDERAALLEKITGTEIYGELSVRAFARAKQAGARLTALRDERARVRPLAPPERAALAANALEQGRARARLEDDVTTLALAAARAAERAQRERALADAQARAAAAERALTLAEVAALAAEQERARLSPLLEAARRLVGARDALDLDTLTARVEQDGREQKRALAALDAARGEHERSVKAYQLAARVLEESAGVLTLESQLDGVLEDLVALDRKEVEIEGARAIASAIAANREAALHDEQEARTALGRAEAERATRSALLPSTLREAPIALARAGVAHAQARAARRELDALILELVVEERALARVGHAADRAALVDNEPCPLCGATEHPFAAQPEPVTVAAQRAAVEDLRARMDLLRALESAAHARVEMWTPRGAKGTEPPHVEALGLEEHAAQATLAALAALDDALGALAATIRDVDAARTAVREREVAHADASTQHAFHVREVERLTGERSSLLARLERALRPAEIAWAGRRPGQVARDLSARVTSARTARAQLEQLSATRGVLEQRVHAAERALDVVAATCRATQAAWQDVSARAVAIDAELATLLAGREVDDVARSIERRRASGDAAHSDARAELASAREALTRARTERDRVATDAHEGDAASALLAARAALAGAADLEASLRAALAEDDRAQAQSQHLDASIASEEAASRAWAELNELIGSHDGARFRSFAQGLTLDTLIFHANAHLDMLAPRYRLERAAPTRAGRVDPSLCVVDRDAGDDRRGVQSLSGGETFLVSLALALGLASLSSSRVRVESLFIDEGFSSLDPDTLETALAAFDALRDSGRQIGVISHVAALAERIGSQVRVLPLGEGRSRVEVRAS